MTTTPDPASWDEHRPPLRELAALGAGDQHCRRQQPTAGDLRTGQKIAGSQQRFRGELGQTSNPKIAEVDAACNITKEKLNEAPQALTAAREAAEQFAASLA